jgi:hypothetical protein
MTAVKRRYKTSEVAECRELQFSRMEEATSSEPRMERHCTHYSGQLRYKGRKEIHEGNLAHILMGRMACDVYVCGNCGHIKYRC